MSKRNITLILILVILIGLGIYYWAIIKTTEEVEKERVEKELLPEDRSGTFFVGSGGGFPVFTKELVVDPFQKVKEGEKQTLSIWAEDPEGIMKVTVTITTDKGDEIIELKLVEGTDKEGKWTGSWITKNISAQSSYSTIFQAENKNGKTTKLTLSWTTK